MYDSSQKIQNIDGAFNTPCLYSQAEYEPNNFKIYEDTTTNPLTAPIIGLLADAKSNSTLNVSVSENNTSVTIENINSGINHHSFNNADLTVTDGQITLTASFLKDHINETPTNNKVKNWILLCNISN